MEDYSQLSENNSRRGGFIYEASGSATTSLYGRSSSSSMQNMPINTFQNPSTECLLSGGPLNVKIEGSSSQQVHEFNYPFGRGVHQTMQQKQRNGSSPYEVDAIKAKIVSHPQYSNLLEAYIACQKVGAPPEVIERLTEISREFETRPRSSVVCRDDSTDPELDQFMEAYCNMLVKYREELTRPLQEAMEFMRRIESQLNTLSNGSVHAFSFVEQVKKKTLLAEYGMVLLTFVVLLTLNAHAKCILEWNGHWAASFRRAKWEHCDGAQEEHLTSYLSSELL